MLIMQPLIYNTRSGPGIRDQNDGRIRTQHRIRIKRKSLPLEYTKIIAIDSPKGFYYLAILPAFAESRQLQLADECGKGTSAGFAEAGALVPPTSIGGAPLEI
jgi:hypothetical protein